MVKVVPSLTLVYVTSSVDVARGKVEVMYETVVKVVPSLKVV